MTYYARSIIVAYCILGGCFLLGCGLTHGVCGAAATIDHPMTLTSTAFHNHARMPKRFTADGRDISRAGSPSNTSPHNPPPRI